MKAPIRLAILFSLCALNFLAFAAEDNADLSRHSQAKADLLLLNGNIYTVNDKQPRAQAVAVKGGRILFVGSNDNARKFHASRVVDLRGRTLVPGLTDSHCHIFGIGERELTLNLERTNTLADFLSKVSARAAKTSPGKWITGRGWIETFWKPSRFPTRQDLDKIATDHPVFLTRADGHASVANSAALKIANIDKNTPNPFGGEILKDKQTGEPTGMLTDSAQELVRKNIAQPTAAEREQALLTGIKREIGLGWCEIQNAGSHKSDIDLIKKAYTDGKAKIRFVNCVYGPGEDAERFLSEGARIDAFNDHLTQRTIKVVFDGALGSRGAALLKPYNDAPDTSGYLTQKPEELSPMFEEALRRGIQVETHAIGDRANRTILDLYEAAFQAVPNEQRKIKEPRWRVEHAQNLDPVDLPRFAKLGVIASMQPSHAISDLFFAPKRLGMDRLAGAYAWQSLLQSGAIICGGSDAPVERGEPMIEFYAAVARKPLPGKSESLPAEGSGRTGDLAKAGWHPEQAVTREQALKMFTIWAAFASFQEKDKGTIEVGKLADFTVLSADIMKISEPEILKTKNEMTIIGGEVVYQKN
ncbi:MAG TPA: amidohydrolase [Chthoniobacterales bacterium]|nr:amidohydrolase [Chthoniobacterales bacterium]